MNMSRTSQILGFSVPPTVVKEVETMAKQERRTKSELFREMVRVYRRYRQQRDRDEQRWVMNIIQEAKAEQEKNPMTAAEMLAEDDRLARYSQQQNKKLGIKAKNISRVVHDYRKARRA
jgi:metal-responsive CopG/Arc/MetJ family transcriptional regulator